MIPFIRSHSELMAITASRIRENDMPKNNKQNLSTIDSAQRKRYIRSLNNKEANLPNLPKLISHKWKHDKEYVSKFFDELDYNNQIQSSYDLTLIDRQNKMNHQDAA